MACVMSEQSSCASHPDWSSFTLEIRCPRCGYDLRMLTVARCPECGWRFSWDVIIAAAKQRLESPLFEDHWHDRPLRSFFGTVGRSLLPWRLWSQARLEHVPHVGPLLTMVPLVMLLYAVYWLANTFAWRWFFSGFWSALRYSGPIYRWPYENLVRKTVFFLAVGCALWLSVQVYRHTLAKHRIRQVHILRVVVLSWTALVASRVVIGLVLMVVGMVLRKLTGPPPLGGRPPAYWMWYAQPAISLALFVASVSLGFRVYLRLPHGWAGGLIAVGLTWAMVAVLLLGLSFYYFDSLKNPWFSLLELWWPGVTRWIISVFQ